MIPKTKFMWVLIAVLAYAYYQEHSEKKQFAAQQAAPDAPKEVVNTEKPEAQNTKTKTFQSAGIAGSILDKISENETGKVIVDALIKNSLEKKYGNNDIGIIAAGASGSITMIDTLKGTGAELNCGAKAVINYDAFNAHGIKFDSTQLKDEKKPIIITVGGGQIINGLEAGIVGMKEGGRRKLSIPAKLAFDDTGFTNNLVGKGEAVSYDVELVEVKDGPYKAPIVFSVVNNTPAEGNKILCGDKAKIKYSFTDTAGTPITDASGEASFTAGSGTVPIGIEAAVLGMSIGSKKTIEMPSSSLKAAVKNSLPSNIKFKDGTPVRVQIEIISETAENSAN